MSDVASAQRAREHRWGGMTVEPKNDMFQAATAVVRNVGVQVGDCLSGVHLHMPH